MNGQKPTVDETIILLGLAGLIALFFALFRGGYWWLALIIGTTIFGFCLLFRYFGKKSQEQNEEEERRVHTEPHAEALFDAEALQMRETVKPHVKTDTTVDYGANLIEPLYSMTSNEFDQYVANLLLHNGFYNIHVLCESDKHGADIIAEKEGLKYAIQCKNHRPKTGNAAVQEIFTGKAIHRCHAAIVCTNNYFTFGAIETAEKTGVVLWNRDKLIEMALKSHESDIHSPQNFALDDLENTDAFDDLMARAIRLMYEEETISVSRLVEKEGFTYLLAGRVIDALEERGFVSSFENSEKRQILISKEDWEATLQS